MSTTSARQSNTAPERSLGQRMDALGRANEVRSRRAALKADLKRGAVGIRDVLQAPPEFLLTAKVQDLLMAAPQVRTREVRQDHGAVPHQPEQDRRRSLGAPARRAARPLRRLTHPRRVRHLGAFGRREGHRHRACQGTAGPRGDVGVGHDAGAAARRGGRPGVLLLAAGGLRMRASRRGSFLEWVEYSGNLYGTLRRDVMAKLAAGNDVILEIELVGARAVRTTMPQAVSVFIAPPSMAELALRLRGRGTETDEAIARRLHRAVTEVAAAGEFDHVVVNDDATRAAAEVAAIIADTTKGNLSGQAPHRRALAARRRLTVRAGHDRRQARAPDQQLLPQPRREHDGHRGPHPAADQHAQHEPPHHRLRGDRRQQDRAHLPE